MPLVEPLVSVPLEPQAVQPILNVPHGDLGEGRLVTLPTLQTARLGQKLLDQVTNCHPTGNLVGVHDDIGDHAKPREGQVLHTEQHPSGTLLPVPRLELVSDLGDLVRPHLNFLEPVLVFVLRQHNRVYHLGLLGPHAN